MNWIKNVPAYFLGNFRYLLYNSFFKFLIFEYILQQIEFRIKIMNSVCYQQGSCYRCGCTTTALQMANKACDGDCYPPMMSWYDWDRFKNGYRVEIKKDVWVLITEEQHVMSYYAVYKNGKIVNVHNYARNV